MNGEEISPENLKPNHCCPVFRVRDELVDGISTHGQEEFIAARPNLRDPHVELTIFDVTEVSIDK